MLLVIDFILNTEGSRKNKIVGARIFVANRLEHRFHISNPQSLLYIEFHSNVKLFWILYWSTRSFKLLLHVIFCIYQRYLWVLCSREHMYLDWTNSIWPRANDDYIKIKLVRAIDENYVHFYLFFIYLNGYVQSMNNSIWTCLLCRLYPQVDIPTAAPEFMCKLFELMVDWMFFGGIINYNL